MSWRRRGFYVGAVVVVVALVITPLLLGFRIVDDRHDRRVANAAVLRANATKIRATQDALAAVATLTLKVCQVQNTDAHRLNTLIDYFETVSKKVQPGAETDAFWARVPRPVVRRCTPPFANPARNTSPQSHP